MQSCKKCRITIRGDKERCPLCGGPVAGEIENGLFPVLPRPAVSRLSFMRVSLFLFLTFEIAMIVLACTLSEPPAGIPFAMAAAAIGIFDIALLVYYRNNLMQLVVLEIYVGLGVAILTDLYTRRPHWSVIWVAPAVFVGLTITIAAVGKASRMRVEEYILYLLCDVIVSTAFQTVMILAGVNTFRIPAIISMAFVIVFFLWMVIFNHQVLGRESRKLFNV